MTSTCVYIYIYVYVCILSRGEESHDKDRSNNGPGWWVYLQTGALVRSVLSSSVLVQGARVRARLWLSGHTLLSGGVKRRERDVSCSLSGGQDSPLSARSAGLIILPVDELQLGPISRQ